MNHIDKYSELAGKRLTGEITPAEQQQLSDWMAAAEENRQFVAELEEIWKQTETADCSPFETDFEQAWANIDAGLGMAERPAKVIPLSKRFGRWSIAAAILLALAAGLWWIVPGPGPQPPLLVQERTGDDEQKELTLPDGSRVWLNENSELSYNVAFEQRQVNLTGEAFFEVERMEEKPFQIMSDGATTTVLGTSFNVRAYPDEAEIEVTVRTGKVALALAKSGSEAVILPAGTSGVVRKAEAKVERVETEIANADAWKTMRLEFDDVPMRDVITALERYFDANISVSNAMIYECPYSSEFDRPDLGSILEIIGGTIDFKVSKTPDGYLLTGPGCKPNN